MTGVPRSIAEHRLTSARDAPNKAKKRGHAPDRNKAIQEEVAKLIGRNLEVYVDDLVIKKPHGTRDPQRYQRNFQDHEKDKHEAESQEMHLRSRGRDVPRPYRKHKGNQGMPEKSRSGSKVVTPKDVEGSTKPQRKIGKFEQILIQIRRKGITLLQNLEKLHKEE
ncbi:hypothetical protein Tco_1503231 [Tanacetum coccineum]